MTSKPAWLSHRLKSKPLLRPLIILALSVCLAQVAVAGQPTPNVLVLYAYSRLMPATIEVDHGLNTAIGDASNLYTEFLDIPRFSGGYYDQTIVNYLRGKYAERPIDVVVAAGIEALMFVLHQRGQLFPNAPVVYLGVTPYDLRSHALPADIVGVVDEYDFVSTVEHALRLHPKAKKLVLVTGTSDWDRDWESRLRDEATRFQNRVQLEFLAGLPTDEVLKRLGSLGDDAVVFTPGYFRDGAGHVFIPRAIVEKMAAAASAPIYDTYNTRMGTGIVGGQMSSFEATGWQAGEVVKLLLHGEPISSPKLHQVMPSQFHVDWRQVKRWGIDEGSLPPGTVVHFREPFLWETHRTEMAVFLGLLLAEALLIAGLLAERRKRKRMEWQAAQDRAQLAHMDRVAMLGVLSASLAHELNQPLTAILANAQAAQRLLTVEPEDLTELADISDDIVSEAQRAAEYIRSLRGLFKGGTLHIQPLGMNDCINQVLGLVASDLLARRVSVAMDFASSLPAVCGDRIQLEQVMLNLIVNAAQAMEASAPNHRVMTIRTEVDNAEIRVSVTDSGEGIPAGQMDTIFEPFVSTKAEGLGIGLVICHSIIRAHGGRLTAANNAGRGATFCFTLPIQTQHDRD